MKLVLLYFLDTLREELNLLVLKKYIELQGKEFQEFQKDKKEQEKAREEYYKRMKEQKEKAMKDYLQKLANEKVEAD